VIHSIPSAPMRNRPYPLMAESFTGAARGVRYQSGHPGEQKAWEWE